MSEKKLLTEIMCHYVGVGEKMPVRISNGEVPVRTGTSRWELTPEKVLKKSYTFITLDERNAFLYTLLQQDGQAGARHCRTTVDAMTVTVELGVNGLIIDLDKQRAKMMDALWRDVVYSISGRQC
jgi:hypothetical protein